MIALLFALLAGIVTIAAPCTLPVLPILLGSALGNRGRARPVFMALGFIATFAAITLVFHFVTSLAGLDADQLRNVAIVLLAGFGVLLLWPGLYARLSPHVAAVTGGWISPGAQSRNDAAMFFQYDTIATAWLSNLYPSALTGL